MFLITCGSRRGGPMSLGQCGQYIDIKLCLIFNIIVIGQSDEDIISHSSRRKQ